MRRFLLADSSLLQQFSGNAETQQITTPLAPHLPAPTSASPPLVPSPAPPAAAPPQQQQVLQEANKHQLPKQPDKSITPYEQASQWLLNLGKAQDGADKPDRPKPTSSLLGEPEKSAARSLFPAKNARGLMAESGKRPARVDEAAGKTADDAPEKHPWDPTGGWTKFSLCVRCYQPLSMTCPCCVVF
jgi:hypothetical protein